MRMKKYHLSFGIISIIWITNEFLSNDDKIVIYASIVILMEGYLPPGHSAGGKKEKKGEWNPKGDNTCILLALPRNTQLCILKWILVQVQRHQNSNIIKNHLFEKGFEPLRADRNFCVRKAEECSVILWLDSKQCLC